MPDNEVRVLVIEDNPGDVDLIREALISACNTTFRVECYDTLSAALGQDTDVSLALACDVALLDLGLPDSCGLDTFRRFHREAPEVPVVILSGSTDESTAITAVKEGAQDYIPKANLGPNTLCRTILLAMERHQLGKQLEYLANRDQLTGLYNRHSFWGWIREEIGRASRYKHPISFLMLDIDHFKLINDEYGHHVGDQVLVSVAKELTKQLRTVDRAFRFGGDEFLVVLPETKDEARGVELRIEDALRSRLRADLDITNPPTISIGAACWLFAAGESIEQVISKADKSMYERKQSRSTDTDASRSVSP